jgi:hypothetical protein
MEQSLFWEVGRKQLKRNREIPALIIQTSLNSAVCLLTFGYFDLKYFVGKALLMSLQLQKSSATLSGVHALLQMIFPSVFDVGPTMP